MNILYLTRTDPALLSMGGEQRTHFVHKGLQSLGTVYTAIPVFRKTQVRTDLERKIAWVYLERRGSFKWLLRNFFLRFMPWIALPSSKPFRAPAEWEGVHFDAVVARQAAIAAYFWAWTIAPLFLDADDLPTEYFMTLSEKTKRSPAHGVSHWIIQQWFHWVCRRAKHIWVAHSGQLSMLESKTPASVLPNIPRPPQAEGFVESRRGNYLFTVGLLSHLPNYAGIDGFLAQNWPAIHKAYPSLTYRIAGGGCPASYADKWSSIEGVELLGYVPDIDPLYRHADGVVAPINTGSGSCIKVLEALIRGRACLGPAFAMRGIPVAAQTEENGILVCENSEEYVRAVGRLLDDSIRRPLAERAQAFVGAHWNQKTIEQEVASTFAQLNLTNGKPRGP